MQWELVVALVIGIPVILFPAAYVWYLNIGGIVAAIKDARVKKLIPNKNAKAVEELVPEQEYENAVIDALKRYPWHQ